MAASSSSWAKKLLFTFSGLCILILLCLSLIPMFCSTEAGKKLCVSFLSKKLQAKVEIQTLSLSWNGPQKVTACLYQAWDGSVKGSVEEILCEGSLFSLLLPSHDLGHVSIKAPNLEIHQKKTAFLQPKAPKIQTASLSPLPELPHERMPFLGDLHIEKGIFSFFMDESAPIVFYIDLASLSTEPSFSKISCHIDGTSNWQSAQKGSFFLDATLENGSLLQSTAKLSDFPIDGLDQVISLKIPSMRHMLQEVIGPSLNMEATIKISKDSCYADVKALSQNCNLSFQVHTETGGIALSTPASFTLSLKPSVIKLLQNDFPYLEILSTNTNTPIPLSLSLDTLFIPELQGMILYEKSAFEGTLSVGPYIAQDLNLSLFSAFSSKHIEENLEANLQIDISHLKEKSHVEGSFSGKSLFSNPHYKASLNIDQTPSILIQRLLTGNLLQAQLDLPSLLGDSIQASFALEGSKKEGIVSAFFSSSLVQTEKLHLLYKEEGISLQSPFSLQYTLQNAALIPYLGINNLSLQNPSDLKVVISSLFIPKEREKVRASITLGADFLVFSKLFSLPNYTLQNPSLQIDVDSVSSLSLQMQSDNLSLTFQGGIEDRNVLFWKKPIQINAMITETELKAFFPQKNNLFILEKTPISLKIDPASFSFVSWDLDKITWSMQLLAENLLFTDANHTQNLGLQNLKGSLRFLAAKKTLDLSLSSDLMFSSSYQGKLSIQGNVFNIFSEKPQYKATVALENLPLPLLDSFAVAPFSLTSLLGPSLDLEVFIDTQSAHQRYTIEGKSASAELSCALTRNGSSFSLADPKKPCTISFLLSPKGYEELTKNTNVPFFLEKETLFTFSLTKLFIPFKNRSEKVFFPDLSQMEAEVAINNPKLSFLSKQAAKPLTLQNVQCLLEKKEKNSPITFSFQAFSGSSSKSSCHMQMHVQNLFTENGELVKNLTSLETQTSFSCIEFPSAVFDLLFPPKTATNAPISLLLGDLFSLEIETSLQKASGPLSCHFSSPNLFFSLDGTMNSGTLFLQKNVKMQVALNPNSSRVLLQKVNPLSLSYVRALSPISLEIKAQGFSLPISPFYIDKIEIPSIRITPGKLFCKNEGSLQSMLSLLKSKQQQSKELELWFAPLDIHIHQGIVDLERTEILVGNLYDIALWGIVNLPGNRVNMVLGLTASCIKEAFRIKGLPEDYVLHIPLTGPLDNVQLNTGAASSKLVALGLWQNANIGNGPLKGLGGGLIGGLMNKVLAPPGNEGSTPPAKKPFPWQITK